jgi:threonine dehydratase
LAKVAGLIAHSEANIIEVVHQRVFTALPAKSTVLRVVIETRDRAHLNETVAKIRAAGFQPIITSNNH